jgi:hypothetical protein
VEGARAHDTARRRPYSRGRRITRCGGLILATAVGAASTLSLIPVRADAATSRAASNPSHTIWLCRPGQADDPCTMSLASTAVTADGTATTSTPSPSTDSKFDCFYVYPTVSSQTTANANLRVQEPETAAAEDQASQFSQVCRVWAPMYRQRTLASLGPNRPAVNDVAYASLLSGWEDYLAHDNHGRPVIFIGHSQGAAMLIRLLQDKVDPNPKLRSQMVSAILLGGNVTVPVGKDVGGSFTHIPTCGSAQQTGCVIAYSSFGSPPPASSLFGRPGTGVSTLSGQSASKGLEVVCVNPVNFSSAKGLLDPYFLSLTQTVFGTTVTTPWVSYPGRYTAQCQTTGGATSLQVIPTGGPNDRRQTVSASLGPDWGFHLDDVNLGLGNLVADVATEESAYHQPNG